jgi:hypothetical protein
VLPDGQDSGESIVSTMLLGAIDRRLGVVVFDGIDDETASSCLTRVCVISASGRFNLALPTRLVYPAIEMVDKREMV